MSLFINKNIQDVNLEKNTGKYDYKRSKDGKMEKDKTVLEYMKIRDVETKKKRAKKNQILNKSENHK